MSLTSGIIKAGVKWTPKSLVLWVANKVLKDIATISDFELDLDTRSAYAQTTLNGETEMIEVQLDGFAIINDGESYRLILDKAQSNKPWLNKVFSHIVGKPWKIPDVPKYRKQIDLLAELLKPVEPIEESV